MALNKSSKLNIFTPVDIITLVYALFTGVYVLIFLSKIPNAGELLLNRLIIIAVLFLFVAWSTKSRIGSLFRFMYPLSLTAYWYPETYFLNNGVLVPNLDGFFNHLDYLFFSSYPAMEFSVLLPQAWFSELMYFGYFAYYIMFIFISFYFFFKLRKEADSVIFRVLCSFLLFYVIFIFVPVSGPQFYFPTESDVPDGYLFSKLMRSIQDAGEQATGAFPSSHVGLCLIYMYIFYKYLRKCFFCILPVAILLIASTVYIKAHYLIDVVGAFVLTPPIWLLSGFILKCIPLHNQNN